MALESLTPVYHRDPGEVIVCKIIRSLWLLVLMLLLSLLMIADAICLIIIDAAIQFTLKNFLLLVLLLMNLSFLEFVFFGSQ